jgi:LysR family transcriptional regulator, low CO2-responsive transcriptional regulator
MALDTRIQLSKLEIFCRVVELKSVTRAADELFLSQPVVSSHVRTLQERLGAKLLYRDGHSMRPTEAGQLAYDWAKDVLTRSQEMSRRIEGLADGSAGHAALAASMTVGSYMLPPLLIRFREQRPGAQIALDVFDPEHVLLAVESGGYDAGFLIGDPGYLKADLAFEQITDQEFVLVAGPASDIPDEISLSELSELELIGSSHDHVREHLLGRLLDAAKVKRAPNRIELGHAEAMKLAVMQSRYLSFVFRSSVAGELRHGELREIRIRDIGRLAVPILLTCRRDKDFSPMQSALIDEIRAGFAAASEPPAGIEPATS